MVKLFYNDFMNYNNYDMTKLEEELKDYFNHAFPKKDFTTNTKSDAGNQKWTPSYRVADSKDSLSLTFDVPGVKKSDIRIVANEYHLIVSCKRMIGESAHTMNESFALSRNHDRDNITSTYVDGVLTVQVPLLKQKQKFEREVPVL
jgi:HSP20 family molecular chaperone IbpA